MKKDELSYDAVVTIDKKVSESACATWNNQWKTVFKTYKLIEYDPHVNDIVVGNLLLKHYKLQICVSGLKFHTLKFGTNSSPTPPWPPSTNFCFSLSPFSSSLLLFSKVCTLASRSRSYTPSIHAFLHVTIIVIDDWIDVKRSYFYLLCRRNYSLFSSPFQLWSAFGLLNFESFGFWSLLEPCVLFFFDCLLSILAPMLEIMKRLFF